MKFSHTSLVSLIAVFVALPMAGQAPVSKTFSANCSSGNSFPGCLITSSMTCSFQDASGGTGWDSLTVRTGITGGSPAALVTMAINGQPIGPPSLVAGGVCPDQPAMFEFKSSVLTMYRPNGTNTLTLSAPASFGVAGTGLRLDVTLTRANGKDLAPVAIPQSPLKPAPSTEKVVVLANGTGLDTACQFRGAGPLKIEVPIKRAVGFVTASGQLVNAPLLFNGGFLSRFAKVTVAAFDVDRASGERDLVYLNGRVIGVLAGSNGVWSRSEFLVPTEHLRFGRNAVGINLEGLNTVEVGIDLDSQDGDWCTSVDWVQIEFDVIAPILLVHGTNSSRKMWDDEFVPYFQSLQLPYSNDINLIPNGSIKQNGALLGQRVHALGHALGTKEVHIIAHSKGGNDVREYLAKHYDPTRVQVLSLNTLSTPFNGTVIADTILRAREFRQSTGSSPETTNHDIRTLMAYDFSIFSTPCCAALLDNQVSSMRAFNRTAKLPGDVRIYSFAADADVDNDNQIPRSEYDGLISPIVAVLGQGLLKTVFNATYSLLGTAAEVDFKIVNGSTFWGAPTLITALEVTKPTTAFSENDLVVSVESAQHPDVVFVGQIDANHGTIDSPATASGILSRIQADYPVKVQP